MSDEKPGVQILKEIILRVQTSVNDLNNAKFNSAADLYWARHAINWKLTDYSSWLSFCAETVNLHMGTINRYVTVVAIARKFGYADDDCKEIIAAIGWSAFCSGMLHITRKLMVKTFISRYRGYHANQGTPPKNSGPGGDRAYTFSLPAEISDKLDGYLELYGMTHTANGRRGVRDAFIQLIGIQLD